MIPPSLRKCAEINPEICSILQNVLKKIKPSETEKNHVNMFIRRIMKEVEEALIDLDVPFTVELHGSIAHNTWLASDRDFDIFILLKEERSKEYLKNEILKRIETRLPYKFEKRYAEHPYLRARIDEFEIDIVPGFYVEKIISAVDRTPKHTRFLKERLNDELADEVRLLKAFLKGIGAYGAEIKVRGFSGYACELLIVFFGSFLDTIQALAEKPKIFIDFTDTWDEEEAFKKFKNKVIIIDPVDVNRNVTANVSNYTFNLAKLASKLFLKKPSIHFFYPHRHKMSVDQVKHFLTERNIFLIALRKKSQVSPDTYWGQARKIEKNLRRFLRKLPELIVYATSCKETRNYVMILLEINRKEFGQYKEIKGPPVWADAKDILQFIEKYKEHTIAGPWIRKSRIMFLARREDSEREVRKFIENYLKSLKIDPSFSSIEILDNPEDILNIVIKEDFLEGISEFLIRKLPWL